MSFMLFPVTPSHFKTYFEESNTKDLERLSGLDLCFQGPVYSHFIDSCQGPKKHRKWWWRANDNIDLSAF